MFPKPDTLYRYPIPYTLYPIPYTLYPIPYTLNLPSPRAEGVFFFQLGKTLRATMISMEASTGSQKT